MSSPVGPVRPWMSLLLVFAFVLTACADGGPSAPATDDTSAPEPDQQPTASSTEPDAEPTPPEAIDATFATNFFVLNGGFAPFFAGVDQGIFEKHGVNLTIELGRGAETVASQVAAGALDFAMIDPLAGVLAKEAGADITYVAMLYQQYIGAMCTVAEQVVLEDWDDLEGLRVAGPAGGAFTELIPAYTDVDWEHVTMEPSSTLPALLAGEVDVMTATAMTVPSRMAAGAAQDKPLDCFLYGENGAEDVLGMGIATRTELVESNPELVQRFVDAVAEAVVWSSQNSEEAIAAMVKANPEEVGQEEIHLETLKLAESFYTGPGAPDWFVVPQGKVEATIAIAVEQLGAEGVSPSDFYTNRFTDELPEELKQGNLAG